MLTSSAEATAKRDVLSVEELPTGEFEAILDLAARVKRGEARGGLEGKILALVFLDPSLRTRASFEAAMALHGGHAIVIEPGRGSWPLETEEGAVMDADRTEHLIEAARVLGRYADALGVRSFARGDRWSEIRKDRIVRGFARYCEKPVINLESARRHPCQELADALTLVEKLGRPGGKKFVLSWAWHPKALPTAVPASAALAAARLGMDVVIARPAGFDLDVEDAALIAATAGAAGGSLALSDDQDAACAGADAIYAKAWGGLDRFEDEAGESARRHAHRGWQVRARHVAASRNGAGIVMHCLPVRRNVEIEDAVLDGASSAVIDEAENRLHVQRALLLRTLGAAEAEKGAA
jgi:N-acetylornithine carbamoyltransferase